MTKREFGVPVSYRNGPVGAMASTRANVSLALCCSQIHRSLRCMSLRDASRDTREGGENNNNHCILP